MNHEPHEPHERLMFADEVFRIQGAIYEVNKQMGAGFRLALLVNFGASPKAEIERLVR